MHNNEGGVEPRGPEDVRPRPNLIPEATGKLAVQGVDAAALSPRPSMGESAQSPTPGIALSYAAAMARLRDQAAKLNPRPRY